VFLEIWDCGWWTKGLQLNSGKVEQMICTSQGVVLVSCVLECLLLCHIHKWTTVKAHSPLKNHIPHIGNLTANELAAIVLWCKLQYRREYVTEMAIGPAVTKRVKDKWLEGEGKNATVKIVIHNAGLDNGLSIMQDRTMDCHSLEQSSLLAARPITMKSLTFTSRTRFTPFFPH
jgi:hypothetical protein